MPAFRAGIQTYEFDIFLLWRYLYTYRFNIGNLLGVNMETKREKVARSLKLEPNLNDRIVALCAHLGVNVNAYVLNEIGKAVSRDEVAYLLVNNQKDSLKEMMDMFKSLSDEQDIPKL